MLVRELPSFNLACLWIAPLTKMDALILTEGGYYSILGKSGARMEMPGCSLRL